MSIKGYAHLDATTGKLLLTEICDLTGVSPSLLSTTTSISLAATGQTALYTVPVGKTLLITGAYFVTTSAATVVGAAIASLGSTTPFTQWISLTTIPAVTTANNYVNLAELAVGVIHNVFAATTVINFNVGTAITSGTLTGKILLFGFLF